MLRNFYDNYAKYMCQIWVHLKLCYAKVPVGAEKELLHGCIVHSLSRKGEENETICFCYLCMRDVAGDLLRARAFASTCRDGDACTALSISTADKYRVAPDADGGSSQPEARCSIVRIEDLHQ